MERKKFLKSLPLIGLSGGLLLSACNTTGSTDLGGNENELEGDAFLINDAAEREAIAIQTYTAAAESGLIESQTVLDTAVNYRSHHREHLEEFNNLLVDLDTDPVELTNFSADERVGNVTNQEQAVELAMTLEFEAAEAYFTQLVNQLQQPGPRRLFGNIYPVEVSHFVSLKAVLGRNPAINAALFADLQAT